ncbi:MAG: hypothetical protein QM703_10050 [Gemmatales bacterium]
MDDIARPSRKGLTFWGVFFSLLLGLGAWWSVGQFTEPRPLWTRPFTANQHILLPLSEAADSNRLVAYEMNLVPGNASESMMTGIVILDSGTGTTLYHLPLPNEHWRPEQYIMQTFHQALPRIIGDVAWRINIVEKEKTHRCELRAWHFTQSQQEQIVQSWDCGPGIRIDVAFTDSASPYMITQTKSRCEQILASFGMVGWSSLTTQLAYSHAIAMKASGERETPFGESSWHPGLDLSTIQTWKLPTSPGEALKPLALWMLPPQNTAWPPACGKDMKWVAFGDLMTRLPNFANKKPVGMLLFDGHTGKPRSHNVPSTLPLFVTAAGDLLMTSSPLKPKNEGDQSAGYQHRIVDPQTGKELALPPELVTTLLPVNLFPDQAQPEQYVATVGIAHLSFNLDVFPTKNNSALVGRFQRTETGLATVKPMVSLSRDKRDDRALSATHFRGNEIGLEGSMDTAPPMLRTFAEKWDWLKNWMEQNWPRDSMTLTLHDINTGKLLRQMRDAMVLQMTNANSKNTLYTITYRRSPPPGREAVEALSAWQLPIETVGTLPWWGRGTGLLVFFLAIVYLARRRPRTA